MIMINKKFLQSCKSAEAVDFRESMLKHRPVVQTEPRKNRRRVAKDQQCEIVVDYNGKKEQCTFKKHQSSKTMCEWHKERHENADNHRPLSEPMYLHGGVLVDENDNVVIENPQQCSYVYTGDKLKGMRCSDRVHGAGYCFFHYKRMQRERSQNDQKNEYSDQNHATVVAFARSITGKYFEYRQEIHGSLKYKLKQYSIYTDQMIIDDFLDEFYLELGGFGQKMAKEILNAMTPYNEYEVRLMETLAPILDHESKTLEVDHIIPVSAFRLSGSNDKLTVNIAAMKALSNHNNFMYLTKSQNRKKSARVNKEELNLILPALLYGMDGVMPKDVLQEHALKLVENYKPLDYTGYIKRCIEIREYVVAKSKRLNNE